jgi:hypothetical protein
VKKNKKFKQPIIQNQVDLILFEEGMFSPLSWLLREGHLTYDDYQKWRKGDYSNLEDYLKTSMTQITIYLQHVLEYAHTLQLESTQLTYASTANQPLQLCHKPENERLFTTGYEPAQDRMQMDLFYDSAPACTESDLITAVIKKQDNDLSELLTKLYDSNPEKHQQFVQLLLFEKQITEPNTNSERKIQLLHSLTPLAFEILGRFSHDFITPLWHKLCEEIIGQRFNKDAPDYHLSYTYFKGFSWKHVISSIEQEPGWVKQPILIFRYAEANFKLNKEDHGLANWFRLFILFPEVAEQLIESTCNRLMFSEWQYFSELEPELRTSLFPAWTVMNKPVLVKNTPISDIQFCDSLQRIKKLTCHIENKIDQTEIQLRTELQKNNPALFIHYMKTISL